MFPILVAGDVEANHRRASSYPLRWSGTVLDTYPRCYAYIVPGDGVRVVAYDGVAVSHMTGDVDPASLFRISKTETLRGRIWPKPPTNQSS